MWRKGNLPLNSQPLQQEGNRSCWTPERSRLCSQRAEWRVGTVLLGLKANYLLLFISCNIHLSFDIWVWWPWRRFFEGWREFQRLMEKLHSASRKHRKWKFCAILVHHGCNLSYGLVTFHLVCHLIFLYTFAFLLETFFQRDSGCPNGLLVFLWGLLWLFIHSHHDLQSGNSHLQLLHTGLLTQVVHKCWNQVMNERGLMKSEVSYFNTSTDIRKQAKTEK